MAARVTRWLTYAVAFALLPLATSLLLRWLSGTLHPDAIYGSPELLFFSLMISAVALGDLSELNAELAESDALLRILFSALLLGAIVSGILYGALVYDQILMGSLTFQQNLFYLSVGLAAIYLLLGTLVQWIIARARMEP